MRWSQIHSGWAQYLERIKKKWTNYSAEIVSVLREEEMKIRREELLREIRKQNEPSR